MGLISFIRKLRDDQRGNVLMLTGFALIPLTFATGMAVDYSRAARLQTKLNAAADAAALSATTKPMLGKSTEEACNAARNTFLNALQQSAGGLTINTAANPTVTIVETYASSVSLTKTCSKSIVALPTLINVPLSREATVTYAANSYNAFGGVLGSNSIEIGGTGTARVSTAPYLDIHVALDTSQSMGLAASRADEIKLFNATALAGNRGCQFGCHVRAGFDPAGAKSNSEIAEANGIEMRIDVLRRATKDMIQTAITNEGATKLYAFGLYQFGAAASKIASLNDDLPTMLTTADTIDLGPNDAGGTGDTNLPDILNSLSPALLNSSPLKIATHGSGSSRATARAFMFIITDGVTDLKGSCTSGHCTAPIDPAQCDVFKANDITVGVVYTTFLPILENPNNGVSSTLQGDYRALVETFSNAKDATGAKLTNASIAPRLQACASPGWYFEASDATGIHTAMQTLFRQAMKTTALIR